jgi:hypothetical protein
MYVVRMYVCMYVCMHEGVHVHVCMYVCMYACMYVCMYRETFMDHKDMSKIFHIHIGHKPSVADH